MSNASNSSDTILAPVAVWPFQESHETKEEFRARIKAGAQEPSKTKSSKKAKTAAVKVKPLPERFADAEEIQPLPSVGSNFQLTISLPWDNYINDSDYDLKTMYVSIDVSHDQIRIAIWDSLPILTRESERHPKGRWVDGDPSNKLGYCIDEYTVDVNLSQAEIDMFVPRVFTAPPDFEERMAEAAVREAECRLERARKSAEAKRLASLKALEIKQAKELADAEKEVSEARKKLVALAPKQN